VTVTAPDPGPVADFTWSCNGLTCTLDGRASKDNGQIVSFAWDLGKYPNPTASGAVVSASYPHNGQRTVTLTVRDNAGQSSAITRDITVGGSTPPTAKFSASCSGASCLFDASASTSSNGLNSYSWNYGDGATGSGMQTTHSYAAGMTSTSSSSVTIAPPPPPPPTNNPPVAAFTVQCAKLACTLDARGSTDDGSIVSYTWNLGKYPNPAASGAVVNTTYPHAGERTVTLTVTDNTGKTSTVSRTFAVN
jgi:hypothetical protein